MNIVIASGKGGTGKTTVVVNLAVTAYKTKKMDTALFDCDVEEPNVHLFFPDAESIEKTVDVMKPVWNKDICNGCGACVDACNFNAIISLKDRGLMLFPELCHTCGYCTTVCPTGAMTESPHRIGSLHIVKPEGYPELVYGKLDIGQVLAPAVVRSVSSLVQSDKLNLIDCAPGTGCVASETISHADIVILVTEPTPFGLHDLKLAVSMVRDQGKPFGIIVNRSMGVNSIVHEYAQTESIPILGDIPFSRKYASLYAEGKILVEHSNVLSAIFSEILTKMDSLKTAEKKIDVLKPKFATQKMISDTLTNDSSHTPSGPVITIISGKGGTGKTSITASLAQLSTEVVVADADVDAADLALLLHPYDAVEIPFVGGFIAVVEEDLCTGCGACERGCRFDAITVIDGKAQVNVSACEGCGLCEYLCRRNAISLKKVVAGDWYTAKVLNGEMVYARLIPGSENSGRLVTKVRTIANEFSSHHEKAVLFVDGPPGTGCPVIASVTGADIVLIVTEPTVSGVHDLKRVVELCKKMSLKIAIVINKSDINMEQCEKISAFAEKKSIPILAEIPFDSAMVRSLCLGDTIIDYGYGGAYEAIVSLYKNLMNMVK